MKTLAHDWFQLADTRYLAAVTMRRSRDRHVRDVCCYLLQESVRQYLISRLCLAGVEIPAQQKLRLLLKRVTSVEPRWDRLQPTMKQLEKHPLESTYPGWKVAPAKAAMLYSGAQKARALAHDALSLQN